MGILIKTNQTDLAYPATAIIPVFHYPTFETKGAHLKGGDFEDGNNRRRECPAACLIAYRFYIIPASLKYFMAPG